MSKYGLHGKLKATSGNGDQLAQILLEAAALVATAQGCQLYLVSRDDQDVDAVWVTEVWDSKEDHQNSLNLPAVKALIAKALPILDGRPESGQVLNVLGGKGIG